MLIAVNTNRGRFRMQLAGSKEDLAAVSPVLEQLAEAATSPDDFMEKAAPELDKYHVTVAETFDVGPKAPQPSLADRVRMIMNLGPRVSVQDCYIHLLTTFQVAEPEDFVVLLENPKDLALVGNYLNSVLYDLDENRPAAEEQLRRVLLPEVATVLLSTEEQ